MSKSVLIEVIINNQCNKRCEYCDLDFRNESMDHTSLDTLIEFLQKEREKVEYFHINFFWGEPLLSFDKIVYFITKVWISNIKYSIWTNWALLNEKILKTLQEYSFQIYLSVDNIDGLENLKKLKVHTYLDLFQVNFINDPDFLYRSENTLDAIVKKWFTFVNFMPVFTTKNWDISALVILSQLKEYTKALQNVEFQYFGYYNWFSHDVQFVLESNMTIYKDLDSLIWLQKQYSLLPQELKDSLEQQSKIWTLWSEITNVNTLLSSYSNKDVLNLIMTIPKVLWNYKQMVLIDKILK